MAAIMDNEEAVKLLTRMGVDVYALIDESPTIYENLDGKNLEFDDFVDVIWQFRPSEAAVMKSLSILRRQIAKVLDEIEGIDKGLKKIRRHNHHENSHRHFHLPHRICDGT